ncbi:VPLPA-CTERM sorting domain-containing protein [Paenirhodobacter sp.]|uniref:VPLPA-CTERM sorting domain-containing protein n=1 Tax=Paenirhodobacter sp. TaxID=1965326 RepID=UPI003B3C27DF
MRDLVFLSVLGLAPMLLSGTALAATCTVSGAQVSCNGPVTGGFEAKKSVNGLNVTVNGEVSNAAGDAIRLRGEGNRVTNHGTIAGTDPAGSDGIDGGHGLTVINTGTITATNKAIDAEEKNDLSVSNTGVIRAQDKAIRNAGGRNAALSNEGLIVSETDEGFESGDNAWILNSGTIRASDDALQVGENASIFNYGVIESVRRGGDEADPQDGIDIDSGIIRNYHGAVIRSDDDAAIDYDESTTASEIMNAGLISGTIGVLTDPANAAAQIIDNYGTIEGREGIAVDLGRGDDALRLYNGSRLLGDAVMGAGDDLLYLGSAITTGIAGGILDGGAGFDTVQFFQLTFADIFRVSLFGDVMSVSFRNTDNDFSLTLSNWDSFVFTDAVYGWGDVAALADVAPVPVPASGLLLAAAFGGLGLIRRR